MPRVRLRDIVTVEDRAMVMGVGRAPGQDEYLNSMPEIFDEADQQQRAMRIRGRYTTPQRARWSASR